MDRALRLSHCILRQHPQEIQRWGTSCCQALVLQVRHPPHTSSPKWTCSRNIFFVLFCVPTSVGVRDRVLFSRVITPHSVGARDMMRGRAAILISFREIHCQTASVPDPPVVPCQYPLTTPTPRPAAPPKNRRGESAAPPEKPALPTPPVNKGRGGNQIGGRASSG